MPFFECKMKEVLRVLIADDMHQALRLGLEKAGLEVSYEPDIKREELMNALPEYHGLVLRSKLHVNKEIIDRGSKLQFIARAGSGMDNVEEAYASARGILCLSAAEGNCDAVGEQTIGLMLNLTRKIIKSFEEIKQGIWDREGNRGEELSDLCVAIIGYGHTGQAVARKLQGFGSNVIFYDKFKKNIPTPYAREALLQEVLDQADVVSFHIPLDTDNKYLINKQFISSFVKPVYLLNLSRGGIMNTSDVLWGLETGKIKAAAFDVLENENPGTWSGEEKNLFEALLATNRIILTPHVAGWTVASYRKISEVLLDKILTGLKSG